MPPPVQRQYTYLTPEIVGRLENLEVLAKGIVEGFISGMHRSPHHGFSVEFAEYREYVPGDPLRHVDWAVLARTDRVVIRQYEQETNLRATIFLDCSRSMNFKSASKFTKFQYACYSAAALVYLLGHQQDAVGLVTHNSTQTRHFPPRSSAMAVREMLLHIESLKPDGNTNLSTIYHNMSEQLPRRSMVILLTDLYEDPAELAKALRHFRHRRHEVILLHLFDDAELNFPYRGLIEFKDLESGQLIEVEAELIGDAVRQSVNEYIETCRKMCVEANIDYHVFNTSEPVEKALAAYLARRDRLAGK